LDRAWPRLRHRGNAFFHDRRHARQFWPSR
jgi:hypothetical protein